MSEGGFDAGSIVSHLKLDMSEFKSGIGVSTGLAAGFAQALTEMFAHAMEELAKGALEAAKSVFELVASVSHAQHDVADAAAGLGVGVEFLDGWGKAAKLAGADTQELQQGLIFLSKAAYEAATQGGEQAKAFKLLGVSVKDSNGGLKSAEQLMRDVADGMHEMGGAADTTAVAHQLLGRASAQMLAFLGRGSEGIDEYAGQLKRLGVITTDSTGAAATKFNELEVTLDYAWEGIRDKLAEPMRDALTPTLASLVKWVNAHMPQIDGIIKGAADGIAAAFKAIGQAVGWAVGHFEQFKIAMRLVIDAAEQVIAVLAKVASAIGTVFSATYAGAKFVTAPLRAALAPVGRVLSSTVGAAVNAGASVGGGGGTPYVPPTAPKGMFIPHGAIDGRIIMPDGSLGPYMPNYDFSTDTPLPLNIGGGAGGAGGGAGGGGNLNVNVNVQANTTLGNAADHIGRQVTAELKKKSKEQEAKHFTQQMQRKLVGK